MERYELASKIRFINTKEEFREFIINNLEILFEESAIQVTGRYNCGCLETFQDLDVGDTDDQDALRNWLHDGSELKFTKVRTSDSYWTDWLIMVHNPHISEMCWECQRREHLLTEKRPDSLLQGTIYSHGLATGFCGHQTPEDLINNMVNFGGADWEVCASWKTQMIGGCGLFIKGDVLLASNRDLWSYLNSSGERNWDHEFDDHIFSEREELDLTQWDHTEFIIRNPKVVGFWMKDWFYNANPKHRRIYEVIKEHSLAKTVCIVKSRH